MTQSMTRRSFVAVGAAGAILATAGTSLTGCATSSDEENPPISQVVNTQCAACPRQCGYAAYTVGGALDKVVGNSSDPASGGTLCACGYGMAGSAYSTDRLKSPQRRKEDGSFESLSWDEALSEIGGALASLAQTAGGEALAAIVPGTSTADWYMGRLMHGFGSANVYDNCATSSCSISSGLAQAIGFDSYEVDYRRARMVVLLGASTVEMVDPGVIESLRQAKEDGAHIVMVDSRVPAVSTVATDFLGVRSGTELSLVLAIAHCLIRDAAVSKEALAAMNDFTEWADSLTGCTPQWASEITGLSSGSIEQVSLQLASAAPAACLDVTWMALFGGSYGNTGELARAVALVNTLLGCWNVPGGAYVAAPAIDWESAGLPSIEPSGPDATQTVSALAVHGTAAAALQLAHDGEIDGLFLVDANVVAEYPDPEYVREAIENCTLSVVITAEMTETAQCCTYILPEAAWIESDQLPQVQGIVNPVLKVSAQVIQPVVEDARSISQIAEGIAQAAGIDDVFPVGLETIASSICTSFGLSLEGARAAGTCSIPRNAMEGAPVVWPTASGKVECSSSACAAVGYSAVPAWVAPALSPDSLENGSFRLVTGNQAVQVGAGTANEEELVSISERYALDSLWINSEVAADAGISDGDEVLVENSAYSAVIRAHVTPLIDATSVYLPNHYGVENDAQRFANGLGIRQSSFVGFALESGYGAPLSQGSIVSVRKVGA